MAITSITIDGASVALADVVEDITITHGRPDITSQGVPSTCQFTVLVDRTDPMPAAIGDPVTVAAYSVPRFTGTVTYIELTHVGDLALARIDATGYLDRLDRLVTGTSAFAEETVTSRVDGVMAATGLTYSVSSDDTTTLIAEAADPVTVRQYLQTLCQAVGATMCDLPDGTILWETYARRTRNYTSGSWSDATGTWADNTQAWQASRQPLELPAAAVVWEPVWYLRQDVIVNSVTIAYGTADPKAETTDTDTASITAYGERAAYLDTPIKNLTDAQARAGNILTAQASPHWNIGQVTVLVEDLDTTTRTAVLNLESGDRVILNGLPMAAPDSLYYGVVEGWTEVHDPTGHRITLNLSDPRYSYAMAQWSDVSGALTWAGVSTTVTWADIVLAADLI